MSGGSAFQVRGPATKSAPSPILVCVGGMSEVRLSAERRCDRPDVYKVTIAIYISAILLLKQSSETV